MKQNNSTSIDVVICWVDGSDELWRKEKHFWESKEHPNETKIEQQWNKGNIRFRDWGTLRYFFRGIEQFAPWVHNIYFVTYGHLPPWLNISHPKLRIVRHEEYIPQKYLPTFNSHTIELNFHRIQGLSEQFIYFNDDQFLTAPNEETDFFRNGLPCDCAILNPMPMTRGIGHAEINNIGIINDHFNKNRVIASHPFKWFNLKYGRKALRTCLMMPWKRFVGLYEQHLPTSFLKSSYEKVWEQEKEELDLTCKCKFRDRSNVNQWLIKNWQIAEGQFIPRSFNIGRMFMYGEDGNYDEVCAAVRSRKWKMLCINDSVSIDDFERRKAQLLEAFYAILPEKSKYELY